MCVLDDVCATMHAVTEGADQTLLEVSTVHVCVKLVLPLLLLLSLLWFCFSIALLWQWHSTNKNMDVPGL